MSAEAARRAKARAIIERQAADSARYQAENPSAYTVRPEAAAGAVAAQRERDAIAAALDSLNPSFAASCAIAAARRAGAVVEKIDRVFSVPFSPEYEPAPGVTPADLAAKYKATRRAMEKSEALALSIQTFIGPRTPEGASVAEAMRAAAESHRKTCLENLKAVHPALSKHRAETRSEELQTATADFLKDSEERTGMGMNPIEYAKQTGKKTKLAEMAREICRRLESVGVQTKRDDGCGLWTYWIHSGIWEEMDQYRRICINPVIAAQTRANTLAGLEYFCQQNEFCRFWTFTTGPRCTVEEIPERLDVYFRKLSKLNHYIKKFHGLEIVIRATEFGTLESETPQSNDGTELNGITFTLTENKETGAHSAAPLYHPHFHTVVRSTIGYRAKADWVKACEAVRAFWGMKCDFGRKGETNVIQNPREVVKYVTKPGDMLKLTPEQLKAFYDATAGRRLVCPMGTLKREIAARKEAGLKLRRIRNNDGDWLWVEKIDHNKTLADCMSPEDRADLDAIAEAEIFATEAQASARAGGGQWVDVGETLTLWDDGTTHRSEAARALVEGAPVRLKDKPDFCQVVAFIPPAAGPTMRLENRVIVMGNRRDEKAVKRHPLVAQLWQRTVEAWEAGAVISVHTGTSTVQTPPAPPPAWSGSGKSPAVQMVFATA
jgi:hypothetical protein